MPLVKLYDTRRINNSSGLFYVIINLKYKQDFDILNKSIYNRSNKY